MLQFCFLPSPGLRAPRPPGSQAKERGDSLLEGSEGDPEGRPGVPGVEWGFVCVFPVDLAVLSDESFVVTVSIPSS